MFSVISTLLFVNNGLIVIKNEQKTKWFNKDFFITVDYASYAPSFSSIRMQTPLQVHRPLDPTNAIRTTVNVVADDEYLFLSAS